MTSTGRVRGIVALALAAAGALALSGCASAAPASTSSCPDGVLDSIKQVIAGETSEAPFTVEVGAIGDVEPAGIQTLVAGACVIRFAAQSEDASLDGTFVFAPGAKSAAVEQAITAAGYTDNDDGSYSYESSDGSTQAQVEGDTVADADEQTAEGDPTFSQYFPGDTLLIASVIGVQS